MPGGGTLEEVMNHCFHGDGIPGVMCPTDGCGVSLGNESLVTVSPEAISGGFLSCGGCGGHITDRFVLYAAGQAWHSYCLRCSLCQCELQSHSSLYCRDGKIFCQLDYCRLFCADQCTRCSQPIPSSALVMRSGPLTFHPHCFSCQECRMTLLPGSLYYVEGGSVYCQSHYYNSGSPKSHTREFMHIEEEGTPRVPHDPGEEPDSSPKAQVEKAPLGKRNRGRGKRIRTCFRSEQLRTMESYFALKHNPDGRDWTSLSHRTGLPKRVLQVWFQNARAKLRRSRSSDESKRHSQHAPQPSAMATSTTYVTEPHLSSTFQTSTIDQEELSLLTAPLEMTPQNLIQHQSQGAHSLFVEYSKQVADRLSPLMTINFGESLANTEEENDKTFHSFSC